MQETTKYLCENIQGCVLGYTQSDEITLVLVDYKKLDTSAWFDYEVQKMCSIAASMATMTFNKYFRANVNSWWFTPFAGVAKEFKEREILYQTYQKAIEKGAMFDCRCFNIPKEEVTNNLYWRQLDCSRNSIQMVGQANFSHKELQNKTCNMIQDMLMTQKGINWNDLPIYQKRGSCCIKDYHERIIYEQDIDGNYQPDRGVWRSEWVIDKEIPIFRNEGREYIEKLINF